MIILDDNEWNFNLTDIILGVFQEYKEHNPWCDREKFSGRNLIEDLSLWTLETGWKLDGNLVLEHHQMCSLLFMVKKEIQERDNSEEKLSR